MAYTISLTGAAEADAYAAFEHIREVAPASAARWLTGLFAAIQTLADMPARCPVIPEAEELGQPLRHLLYGRRTGTFRIIFDIQEDSEEGEPSVTPAQVKVAFLDGCSKNLSLLDDRPFFDFATESLFIRLLIGRPGERAQRERAWLSR